MVAMLRYLADENFHNHVVRGLRRQLPQLDLVRAVDVGLESADDPTVLAWAADNHRVLLTHDVRTIRGYAEDRLRRRLAMRGVVFVPQPFSRAQVIEELALIAECYEPGELDSTWLYIPLR